MQAYSEIQFFVGMNLHDLKIAITTIYFYFKVNRRNFYESDQTLRRGAVFKIRLKKFTNSQKILVRFGNIVNRTDPYLIGRFGITYWNKNSTIISKMEF